MIADALKKAQLKGHLTEEEARGAFREIMDGAAGDGFMRLNIGCTRDILRQGLEGLERFYQAYVK